MEPIPYVPTAQLRSAAQPVMTVEDVTQGIPSPYARPARNDDPLAVARGDSVRLRGRLSVASTQAFDWLSDQFAPLGFTPVLRKDADGEHDVVVAMSGQFAGASQRIGVAAVLFALTVLSVVYVGAQLSADVYATGLNLLDGIPYAVSLLAILMAHEMGHYVVGRRLRAPLSLPYFLPLPVPPLGTLGAVITMSGPVRNRRHLLAIAAAGPLAGLVVAIPVLLIGLSMSEVQPLPTTGQFMAEGNSLLYLALKFITFGQLLPSGGLDVVVSPIAFAGWAGILITGLNLIPAGQLDGGHIVYALVGARYARYVLYAVLAALAVLAIFWQGWLLWMVLIFLFGRTRLAPLDEITELTTAQKIFAAAMLVLFFLVFTPVPLSVVGG
ncbi:MAG: site-2 protease family protein [Anaerolineales bacterium]|nr:site-2 protease family protein [Anaerolineales bacterium]